ncbi:MAG: DUF560 domain-containing protein [Alphaproteobacteria bacterium]|nr:DUF560 domain-containing protein [Alphaproteobacteria bacterium]
MPLTPPPAPPAAVAQPLAAPAVPTATTQTATTQTLAPEDAAALLMQARDFKNARKLLNDLERRHYKPSEVEFLLAMLDMQDHDYDGAVRLLRRILVREPGVIRVRLELARAFFAKGDYLNAERQFRLARAGQPPPAVIANIDAYLYAIRRLKRYAYNMSVAVAPDTNLNAGPSVESVTLYGLPFQLSSAAKQQSGIGGAVTAGGEWSPPLGSAVKFRLGGEFSGSFYGQSAFDDVFVTGYSGVRITLPRWDFDVLANAAKRWFGGAAFLTSVGPGVDATYHVSGRTGVSLAFNWNNVQYPYLGYQSGPVASTTAQIFYAPTPVSLVSVNATLSRQASNSPGWANWSEQIGVEYIRDLKGGITFAIAPSYTHFGYDVLVPAFGVRRVDNFVNVRVSLLDRAVDIHGFTPRVSYIFSNNASNVPLYAFGRNRVEIGVTNMF